MITVRGLTDGGTRFSYLSRPDDACGDCKIMTNSNTAHLLFVSQSANERATLISLTNRIPSGR